MSGKVLHLLSQRPLLTGSGITLDAQVSCASAAGWQQRVVCGIPAADPTPAVGDLRPEHIHPLLFETPDLDFPLPGMSDVMPYRSSRFSALTAGQLDGYRDSWRRHLDGVLASFLPDVIHSHHVWLLSALIKDLAPELPLVIQCHATGLRQMELCPHLAEEVCLGCRRGDGFLVLHRGHARELARRLDVPAGRIHLVRTGFREDLFHAAGLAADRSGQLLYTGKYSAAKGLPALLDAVEGLSRRFPGIRLHVAGGGAGEQADRLRRRMQALAPVVVLHGQLPQAELADLMRRCAVCVLPSFFEGVPLVLVEALACGCRLVATALPGVEAELAPHLGSNLDLVPLPPLLGPDQPDPQGLPTFVARLETTLGAALARRPLDGSNLPRPEALDPFTWRAAFARVEAIWRESSGSSG